MRLFPREEKNECGKVAKLMFNFKKRIAMKKIFVTIVVLFTFLFAQANEAYKNNLYTAYTKSNMKLWESTITLMEYEYKQSGNIGLLYKLTNAEYGFIAYNIGNENVDKAEKHLKKAINYAEKLIESGKYQSEAYALQGAFYAFKIGLKPITGAIWGPKSLRSINKAMELDASNPTAWLEKANSLYYMPEAFGGSKENAILHYKRAVNIYEQQGEILNNWMYLNTLTTLAQGYENNGKHEKAVQVYKKILSIEPRFDWVKNELYPKLLAKIND